MPLSVRIDARTEARIKRLAFRTGHSKSQVVREAIATYAGDSEKPEHAQSAYERLKHVIGVARGGSDRLSEDTGDTFAALARAKRHARRPR